MTDWSSEANFTGKMVFNLSVALFLVIALVLTLIVFGDSVDRRG